MLHRRVKIEKQDFRKKFSAQWKIRSLGQILRSTNVALSVILEGEESSSPGEFHPQALTDPDVTVSRHPALIVQPSVASPFANGQIDWVPSLQCALTNRPP